VGWTLFKEPDLLDFLALVDEHPSLFFGPDLKNANTSLAAINSAPATHAWEN